MIAKQQTQERIGMSVRVAHTTHGPKNAPVARFHRVVPCLIPVRVKKPKTQFIVWE